MAIGGVFCVNYAMDGRLVSAGRDNVVRNLDPSMGSEDFSFMLQKRPGAYARLGQGGAEGGCVLGTTGGLEVPCRDAFRSIVVRSVELVYACDEALRLIEKEKITYFVGVPTMSLEIMNHPDRNKYDLSSLKDITAGGAPRPAKVATGFVGRHLVAHLQAQGDEVIITTQNYPRMQNAWRQREREALVGAARHLEHDLARERRGLRGHEDLAERPVVRLAERLRETRDGVDRRTAVCGFQPRALHACSQ